MASRSWSLQGFTSFSILNYLRFCIDKWDQTSDIQDSQVQYRVSERYEFDPLPGILMLWSPWSHARTLIRWRFAWDLQFNCQPFLQFDRVSSHVAPWDMDIPPVRMPRGMSERLRGLLCTPESPIFKAIAPLAVDPVMDPMHPVNMDPMANGLSTSGKICVSSCIPVFNRKINRENYLYSTATVRFPLPVSTKWMAITPPNMHRVHQGIPLGVAGQISPSPPRCDPPHKTSFRFAWF